jgi:3-hydroxyacyl-CoA dehydrogenase
MKHPSLNHAVVIGAGAMGAGIAAHLANAGVKVHLLDRVAAGTVARNSMAEASIERQLKGGGFMHADRARWVTAGNVEDDLGVVANADWIIEAIYEDLGVKQDLYRKIESVRREGSVVSSNTSTIPLRALTEGMSPRFKADFAITHFFNPPRVMELLELVGGETTSATTLERLHAWCEVGLGKTVVGCRDTPGFIANRIGNYWMSVAVLEAKAAGLTVEQADAVMGKPFGIPRTGVFGLFDYVGLNLIPLVWGSFMKLLGPSDAHRVHDITRDPLMCTMVTLGRLGRSVGKGFYRTREVEGTRVREALDLRSCDYRPLAPAGLESLTGGVTDLREIASQPTPAGNYAWRVLSHLVAYAAEVAPEIAGDVDAIDTAMRLGYNWQYGPFQLADRVGAGWIAERLVAEGRPVPELLATAARRGRFYQAGTSLRTDGDAVSLRTLPSFAARKQSGGQVAGNASASLWDSGDGVLVLEVHTKMNACDMRAVEVFERVPEAVRSGFRAVVIANDNPRAFSVGADLSQFVGYLRAKDWAGLASFVERGQMALHALHHAPFPVVAAAGGIALGGGCELQMASHVTVAHAEFVAGLPERKVGIIPGWGGCVRLLGRLADARTALNVLAAATPSTSALEAVSSGMLRADDVIIMNRGRVFEIAREQAIRLASGPRAERAEWNLPVRGSLAAQALVAELGSRSSAETWTARDMRIIEALAAVVTGGDAAPGTALSERDLLKVEREQMLELARTPAALARMEHMLETGKPLLD